MLRSRRQNRRPLRSVRFSSERFRCAGIRCLSGEGVSGWMDGHWRGDIGMHRLHAAVNRNDSYQAQVCFGRFAIIVQVCWNLSFWR